MRGAELPADEAAALRGNACACAGMTWFGPDLERGTFKDAGGRPHHPRCTRAAGPDAPPLDERGAFLRMQGDVTAPLLRCGELHAQGRFEEAWEELERALAALEPLAGELSRHVHDEVDLVVDQPIPFRLGPKVREVAP